MDKLQSKSGQYPHSASLTIIEGDLARLAPGPGGPPPFRAVALPERYNMPLFELLVVDPDFVFVSWELSQEQLEHARQSMGEQAWNLRRLILRFVIPGQPETELARRELYGDSGRWFVELRQPDLLLSAELAYEGAGHRQTLASAGPLQMPRVAPVEGDFIELQVNYGTAPDGHLTVESTGSSTVLSAASIAALALRLDPGSWPGASSVPATAGSSAWSSRP